jgi:predicted RNase H-like HicB family nuclease
MWLGYLEDYPDYWTQGETEAALRENLLDIYETVRDLHQNKVPAVLGFGFAQPAKAEG